MIRQSKYGPTWDTAAKGESQRPFRIWDARARANVRWRCYGTPETAVRGVVAEMALSNKLTSYEVWDIRNGRLYRQYTRTRAGITIHKE